jgi:hypothetical protein
MIQNASPTETITDADLPPLFCASDQAAASAQRRYTNFIRADLLLLVTVAAIGIYAPAQPEAPAQKEIIQFLAFLRAALLVVGLTLAIALATTRPDREWHEARRVAEATRSLAWRYMICHDFTQDQFLKRLGELLEKREELAAALIGQTTTATPITPRMAEVRGGETPARRDIYFQQRLGAQQAWYVVKSAANRKRGGQWYGAVVFCQAAAAIYAIVLASHPAGVNAVEFLTIATTACLSWMQTRQNQQLAQSYGLAAHQLGLLAQARQDITEESALCALVERAEQVISGEIGKWYAQHSGGEH